MPPSPLIRPTLAADLPLLRPLAQATGVFKPAELATLDEVLAAYISSPGGEGYHAHTILSQDQVAGFAVHGPNTMTDRTWDLYWIAIDPNRQGQGLGGQLMRCVEENIRRHRGRLIVVETSSLPSYDLTRRFYLKHGYTLAAAVRDYYAEGDSLVLFTKKVARIEP